MNATDILGEILGGGKGGGIFKDIFGKSAPATPARKEDSSASADEIARQARELEGMIGLGRPGGSSPASRPAEAPSRDQQPAPTTRWDQPAPANTRWDQPAEAPRWDAPVPSRGPAPERGPAESGSPDSEALVLIQAMVNAAKADGRLTPGEQRAITDHIGEVSPEAVRFLEREFQRPLDVRAFAWSVPIGMEYKVYMISLSAIELDSKAESEYLDELARGLRLPREVRANIHQRFGLPAPSVSNR